MLKLIKPYEESHTTCWTEDFVSSTAEDMLA